MANMIDLLILDCRAHLRDRKPNRHARSLFLEKPRQRMAVVLDSLPQGRWHVRASSERKARTAIPRAMFRRFASAGLPTTFPQLPAEADRIATTGRGDLAAAKSRT
jgi:hypothetical protein